MTRVSDGIGLCGQKQNERVNLIAVKAEEAHALGTMKPRVQRSARAIAKQIIKKNARHILDCWDVSPFRWTTNRFKCAYCESEFTDCTLLRQHVRICATEHTIKDIYIKFKEMTLINIDLTGAKCKFCSKTLKDVADMRSHVKEHGFKIDLEHPDGVLPFRLDKESWNCVICCEKFNNFLKLYEHMNCHYQHYICDICGKGYMTAPRLRKHSEVHRSGTFSCQQCGLAFSLRADRDKHKYEAHRKAQRYSCPHCEERFENYYERLKHLSSVHREKEVFYSCSHCELQFKTSAKRAHHVRSTHFLLQKEYQCDYCEWSFKTKHDLKRHVVKHTGKKKFHCTICAKEFARKKALKVHMAKTHQFEEKCSQLKVELVDLAQLIPAS